MCLLQVSGNGDMADAQGVADTPEVQPWRRRSRAKWTWSSRSLPGRPGNFPSALARFIPATVRRRMASSSRSAVLAAKLARMSARNVSGVFGSASRYWA